jgi:GT2 family glycosyltransferase
MDFPMKAFVVIATKGRAKETYVLLDYLAQQTQSPAYLIIVGSEQSDVEGLAAHPSLAEGLGEVLLSRAGLTIQRNVGLDALRSRVADLNSNEWSVTFYDDDFRPAPNWLENASAAFAADPRIAGLTGNVLADGVNTEFGINEADAALYISGQKAPQNHWSSSTQTKVLTGLYGCNMAYRGTVALDLRFDESLPSYGWQEDYDYSSRARQFGDMVRYPGCRGVHMGVSSGRTSGVRFGYSQISNPIFLVRKGSMSWSKAFKLISKNFIANVAKTIFRVPIKDFPGRLKGNYLACVHLLSGKLHPQNIMKI